MEWQKQLEILELFFLCPYLIDGTSNPQDINKSDLCKVRHTLPLLASVAIHPSRLVFFYRVRCWWSGDSCVCVFVFSGESDTIQPLFCRCVGKKQNTTSLRLMRDYVASYLHTSWSSAAPSRCLLSECVRTAFASGSRVDEKSAMAVKAVCFQHAPVGEASVNVPETTGKRTGRREEKWWEKRKKGGGGGKRSHVWAQQPEWRWGGD